MKSGMKNFHQIATFQPLWVLHHKKLTHCILSLPTSSVGALPVATVVLVAGLEPPGLGLCEFKPA